MATYLFSWNPAHWGWKYLQNSITEINKKGYCSEPWSCGVTKKIRAGDRAFLIKLGVNPRGIIASGWVASDVYEDKHWNEDNKIKGKTALYVDVNWETLLDFKISIFPRSLLDSNKYSQMHWEPRASGIRIPDDIAGQLEKDWAKFLNRPVIINQTPLPEEIDDTKTFTEGSTRQITINVYERNAEARSICINRYGLNCMVCGFKFENSFGNIGEGFIHVHHIKPISEVGRSYKLNPITDLRPVCPNCHAMLHQRKPAYSIEELKDIINHFLK